MPTNEVTRNMRDGQIYITDADGITGENYLLLDTEEGDFGLEWGNEPRLIKQRGSVDNGHFREGDEEATSGTINVKLCKIRADSVGGDTEPTPVEALKGVGALAADWLSDGLAGEPHLCKLILKIANPDTTGRREVIELGHVRCGRVSFSEGDEYDTLAFPFTSREVEPTFSFEAQ